MVELTTQRQIGAGGASEIASRLMQSWRGALASVPEDRAAWQVEEGGGWDWQPEGTLVAHSGDWSALRWSRGGPEALRELGSFRIELTVAGSARAAGLSFGPFKDFLVPLAAGPRRIELTIDAVADCWCLRVDGELAPRVWWDADVRTAGDLLGGSLTFKVQGAGQATFHDLAVHAFRPLCQLSVIITCHRFLQRLRVVLRNWCEQELPFGAYELLIVNPASPDGAHEYLAAVARSSPHLAVREIAVEPRLAINKGAMINRAVAAANGTWIWLTDADCLFAPSAAAAALAYVRGRPPRLFYGQRRHLDGAETDALLSGRLDGLRDFTALASGEQRQAPDAWPWGYTQIVPRAVFEYLRYEDRLNTFARSDDLFIAACAQHGLPAELVPGLFCVHLSHPFAWNGAPTFL